MALKQVNYDHNPVLYNAVENYIQLKNGDTAIDCTLGLGGHSRLFAKAVGENGTLAAFELDEKNLETAKKDP